MVLIHVVVKHIVITFDLAILSRVSQRTGASVGVDKIGAGSTIFTGDISAVSYIIDAVLTIITWLT